MLCVYYPGKKLFFFLSLIGHLVVYQSILIVFFFFSSLRISTFVPFIFLLLLFWNVSSFYFLLFKRRGDGMECMNPALSVRLVISLDFIKFLVENEQSWLAVPPFLQLLFSIYSSSIRMGGGGSLLSSSRRTQSPSFFSFRETSRIDPDFSSLSFP
jgi:polyferredoxin